MFGCVFLARALFASGLVAGALFRMVRGSSCIMCGFGNGVGVVCRIRSRCDIVGRTQACWLSCVAMVSVLVVGSASIRQCVH